MIISIDTEKVFDNIQPLSRNKNSSQVGRENYFQTEKELSMKTHSRLYTEL